MSESYRRSIIKALLWRVVGALLTFAVALIITQNSHTSVTITIFREVASTFLYYLHERIWNRIKWGKEKSPAS